ncbi:anthranilate synthase [Gammaproteobacteria bacterium SCGC AG-212-F23]|nr:anthranilate synthase [Gammaproteobacteria bacterium SCGC AG-212-F23]
MILMIDNYDSFTFNLYQGIAELYPAEVKVIRNDKITLAEIDALNPAGIILSPGPGRPEHAGICIALIKKFFDKIPILGICLGHQAIAYAFGGQIIPAPNIMHGKQDFVFHQRQGLYQGISLPFIAGRYHSLITDKYSLPNELIIEAENANDLVMGIRHKHYPVYGLQFHPESILTPEGTVLLKNFVNCCTERAI